MANDGRGMCEGRVCIVTGAGRGIGREHALMLAEHGAKVVVNDLGGEMDGTGQASTGPAQDVVEEIKAMGGEAISNGDDVSDWSRRATPRQHGDRDLRRPRRAREQRGHPARPHAHEHDRGRVGRRHQGASEGNVRPEPSRGGVLARAGEGGRDERRPHHQHHLGVGHLRQPGPDELRRGQDGHRRLHDHQLVRARSLRRHRERHRSRRAHPHDREPRHGAGERGSEGADGAALDRTGVHVARVAAVGRRHRRVFEASGNVFAIAESWHRGPTAEAVDDPTQIDAIARKLLADARPNADMQGRDRRG